MGCGSEVDAPAFGKRLVDDEGHRSVSGVLQEVLALFDGDVDALGGSIDCLLLPVM